MPLAGRPRQKPDYRLERLDKEILLYHPARTRALYLNETASLIWKLCNGERTVADITRLLADAYPEQSATIETEVAAALRTFVEQDALEYV